MSNYDKYLGTYGGRELLKKYKLNTKGTWVVRGEDPNCDLGGNHYQPILGYFEGTLGDVISYAVDLPGFWQWGYGGDFELVKLTQITEQSAARRAELLAKKADLEAQLKEINESLLS